MIKFMHKKKLFFSLILTSIFSVSLLYIPPSIEARSGCCSHHGGVVGCGCGDGTPLSSTCAPYYPECSSDTRDVEKPSYVAPATVKPVPSPVLKKPVVVTSPQSTPTTKPSPTSKAVTSAKASPSPLVNPTASASATPVATIEPSPLLVQSVAPSDQKAVEAKTGTQSSGFWGWVKHLFVL